MPEKNKLVDHQRRVLALGLALLPVASFAVTEKSLITMWKSPSCGCCKDWANHVEKNGFTVKTYMDGNDEMRKKLGMPIQFGSCHTALIGGYAIEGHVPAKEIKRLLVEKPKAIDAGQEDEIRSVYKEFSLPWQKKIVTALKGLNAQDVAATLENKG